MPQANQPRRFQFPVRVLMIGTAAVALELWLIREIVWEPHRANGVGHMPVRIVFEVLDADSDRPLEGATVSLENPNFADASQRPRLLALKTGLDGTANFAINATVYSVQKASWQWERRVSYPAWRIKIEAPGYLPFADDQIERWGHNGFRARQLPPASHPFVVRLYKQSAAAKFGRAGSR